MKPVCPHCGAVDSMDEIDRVAVLQKVKSVTDSGKVELVDEAGEVDWECQYPRDNPPEFQCGECGEGCSEAVLIEVTRKVHYNPGSAPAPPIALRSAGYGKPLRCVGLNSHCGDVFGGVAFEFGRDGVCAVPLEDLEKVVAAALENLEKVMAAARQVRAGESKGGQR